MSLEEVIRRGWVEASLLWNTYFALETLIATDGLLNRGERGELERDAPRCCRPRLCGPGTELAAEMIACTRLTSCV